MYTHDSLITINTQFTKYQTQILGLFLTDEHSLVAAGKIIPRIITSPNLMQPVRKMINSHQTVLIEENMAIVGLKNVPICEGNHFRRGGIHISVNGRVI